MTEPTPTDPGLHRRLAVDLFNRVWTLLDMEARSPAEDDEMLHAARASRHHRAWSGDADLPNRLAVGEWQCSRVYSVLGRAEPALHHAERSLQLCQAHGIGDYVIASAYEAHARASRLAGDDDGAARYLALGRSAAEAIAEDDDRQIVNADLDASDPAVVE